MTLRASTIRPGLLVSLKTSIHGGVSYDRRDLGEGDMNDGAHVSRWETTKTITDPVEFERATKTRNEARRSIARVCVDSGFGLLCPAPKEEELSEAISAARAQADAFNGSATTCHIEINVLAGRVASDDVEAARAIGSEVRELIDAMKLGVAMADPKAIRDAANKAKSLGAMLTKESEEKVSSAIAEAREAARAIVKRVEKGGETAAKVIDECSVKALDEARFAFLDMEPAATVESTPITAAQIDV